ncbi:Inositol-1-monophosphatase [hydrothermal vent metagenome]|uniref:inositol-phosphate phosphatase n=1 Tax=hydrothermal vent metagenome TaxID=652676 RepID=A0A3B0RW77_9ZZZZ
MVTASGLHNIMMAAARKAARALNRDFGEVENLQVSKKGPADFVTAADRRAEEVIVEELSISRPGYGFLLEEGGEIKGSDPSHRFIVDPLDGTTNFLHSIPHFCISIALERQGELVAGVIYDPVRDEMFRAEKGKGAFVNDRRLRVSARTDLQSCLLSTGIPFKGKPGHAQFLRELHRVSQNVAGVRRFGSAALDLAWLAAGRYDGFWERNLQIWDIAAGIVLVREAGGLVTNMDGGKKIDASSILATTPGIYDEVKATLDKAAS